MRAFQIVRCGWLSIALLAAGFVSGCGPGSDRRASGSGGEAGEVGSSGGGTTARGGSGGATTSGGTGGGSSKGGTGGSTSTGGKGGSTSAGGAGGSTSTGGAGGSTSTGGKGGSTSTGGTGGSTSTGGAGGSTSTGGAGGTTSTGGTGGSTSTGGTGGTAPAAAFLESNGAVTIEAEHFSGMSDNGDTPWATDNSVVGFVGDGYMVVKTGEFSIKQDAEPAAALSFRIAFATTGTYHLFIHSYYPDAAANSLFYALDAGSLVRGATESSGASFVWRKLGTVVVGVDGIHTLTLRRRESNVGIDRIYLSTTDVAPTGTGGAESLLGLR